MKDLTKIINNFENEKIAVFGDIILDKYIYGNVERISPEAPVPIVHVTKENYQPGGAANVAMNIQSLGGKALLFGIVGDDSKREVLFSILDKNALPISCILMDNQRSTIQKTRVIGLNQQLLRIDHESTEYIKFHFEKIFLEKLKAQTDLSAIIVSDYAKGTITKRLMAELKNFSRIKSIPLIIDPKPKHRSWYKNSTLITPNLKEACLMTNSEITSQEDLEICGEKLKQDLETDIIITTGKSGMSIFHDENIWHIPTAAREVYDVSGAGDTVIATLALSIAAGADLKSAAHLANEAAGIKVRKVGTQPVYLKELLNVC